MATIKVKITKDGSNRVIEMDVEEYLRGVVPSEMYSTFELEALKAQAIAARTYAVRRIGRGSYDVTDTTSHQAYNPAKITPRTDEAVKATSGVVLRYDGKLIDAVYCASNGGKSVSAKEKWGNEVPYLQAKSDEYTVRSGYKKSGHGVGMSQRGAQQMALEGFNHKDILAFYYPSATLWQLEGTTDMNNNASKPFTNKHFAEWCLKMEGQPYWYGTCVYNCTTSVLNRKKEQYPSHYKSDRMRKYNDDIAKKYVAADCIGGVKGYAWTNGGQGVVEAIGTGKEIDDKYLSNGCPDKNANGMFSWAKSEGAEWGSISTLPEIVGLALHSDGHVGYYVGNGWAIEWRGFAYGCVKTKVSERGWKYWYKLPFIVYDDTTSTPASELGARTLRNGDKGEDVRALQNYLIQFGYSMPKYGADGHFGNETEKALQAFQTASWLMPDGIYGEQSHKALMDALADSDDDVHTDEEEIHTVREVEIVNSNGRVNIREGNGTNYARITTAPNGSKYEYVATASNGWHALVINGKVGWVSGKLSNVI